MNKITLFLNLSCHKNPQQQAKVKEYERQIDQLVYKLYELTEEEIKVVENLEKK